MEESTIRRLNWGCGAAGAPGWLNSDIREGPDVQIVRDIREGLPLEDDSLDYAVSIHALPEIPYPDLVPVLQELKRVIKPGGVLRLALPDLEKGFAAFQNNDRSYFVIPDEDARTIGAKLVAQLLWYGHSHTLFTADFIAELLERAGFASVQPASYRKTNSRFADITELDDRERESLFVEAVK